MGAALVGACWWFLVLEGCGVVVCMDVRFGLMVGETSAMIWGCFLRFMFEVA